MDCSVIYYSARKTSLCEKALRRGTASLGLRMASTCFATDAKSLGERLREAFQRGRVCFVAGGLSSITSCYLSSGASATQEFLADMIRSLFSGSYLNL